jgi:hypothetical protein
VSDINGFDAFALNFHVWVAAFAAMTKRGGAMR